MLAARVHAFGTDPVVEDVPEPAPADGEALVEVVATPLAHFDLTVAGGNFPVKPPLPYTPGTGGAGRVVRAPTLAPGTPVRLAGGGLGMARDGAWAELVAAPEDALQPLAADADLPLAAIFASPAGTAWVAVHDLGGLAPGETLGVTGAAGAVGSLAVQLGLRAGNDVVALVGRPEKRGAVATGARVVVAPDEPEPQSLDLLVDCVGGPRLPRLVRAVKPGGRIVLVGYTAGEQVTFDLPNLFAADVRLLPLNMQRRRLGDRLDQLLAQLRSGELTLPYSVRPLSELAAALDEVRSGRAVGRVVLAP